MGISTETVSCETKPGRQHTADHARPWLLESQYWQVQGIAGQRLSGSGACGAFRACGFFGLGFEAPRVFP